MPVPIYLAHVSGGDEMVVLLFTQEIEKLCVLILGEEGDYFYLIFSGISALKMVEGATAMDSVDDIILYLLMMAADYADALTFIKGICEVVYSQTVDPCSNQADHNHLEGIDCKCRTANQGTGNGNGRANIEMQVFVHNFRKYVEAAGRCIDTEKDGLGNAQHKNETDKVQPGIIHHGCTFCDKFIEGQNNLPQINQRTKD